MSDEPACIDQTSRCSQPEGEVLPLGFAADPRDRDTSAVTIRFQPNVGDTLRMRVTEQYDLRLTRENASRPVGGQSVTQFMTYSVDSLFPSKTYSVSQNIDRVIEETNGTGQSATYDSEEREAGCAPVTQTCLRWQTALQQPLRIHIARTGEVKGVPSWGPFVDFVIGKAMDWVTSQLPPDVREPELEKALEQSEEMFRRAMIQDDFIRPMLHQTLPDAPIRLGDSWTQAFRTSIMKPFPVEAEYTLRRIDGDIAHVDVKFDMTYSDSTKADPAIMSMPSMSMRARSANGTFEGVRLIHIPTGITTRMDVSGSMNIEFSVRQGRSMPEQNIQMEGDRSFSMRYLEGLGDHVPTPVGGLPAPGSQTSSPEK